MTDERKFNVLAIRTVVLPDIANTTVCRCSLDVLLTRFANVLASLQPLAIRIHAYARSRVHPCTLVARL